MAPGLGPGVLPWRYRGPEFMGTPERAGAMTNPHHWLPVLPCLPCRKSAGLNCPPSLNHCHLPMTRLNRVSLQLGRAGWASSNFHICASRSLIGLMAFARLHALGPAFRESRNPTGPGRKRFPQPVAGPWGLGSLPTPHSI